VVPVGPKRITNFDENRPAPDGYTMVTRHRTGLVIAGAITLGVSYGIAVLVAAVIDDEHRRDPSQEKYDGLYVPVLGPFLELGRHSSTNDSVSNDSSGRTAALLELGAAQVAGAIMLGIGLWKPRKLLIRNDLVMLPDEIGAAIVDASRVWHRMVD
jgi:hypothetical protein